VPHPLWLRHDNERAARAGTRAAPTTIALTAMVAATPPHHIGCTAAGDAPTIGFGSETGPGVRCNRIRAEGLLSGASGFGVEAYSGRGFASVFVTAADGLRLHVRRYGSGLAAGVPVLCLTGCARTAADFHAVASALADDPVAPRQVLALDYRGHGRSEYDRNPDNYRLPVDLADVSAVLTALEIAPALLVGTSHGGLIAMMLAVSRPTAIAGAILNDIGPIIEAQGLLRLRRYVGQLPVPRSHAEGGEILRRLFDAQFTQLSPQEWTAFAQRTWREKDGRLVSDHDARLAQALGRANLERPPTLWEQFDALGRVPLMVIRGANSDMLASTTLNAMVARRAELEVAVVPDQGHPPLLAEPRLIRRIADFAAGCDVSASR
jgi:pimeloyl-ACP methyl ester carboxylesterase